MNVWAISPPKILPSLYVSALLKDRVHIEAFDDEVVWFGLSLGNPKKDQPERVIKFFKKGASSFCYFIEAEV